MANLQFNTFYVVNCTIVHFLWHFYLSRNDVRVGTAPTPAWFVNCNDMDTGFNCITVSESGGQYELANVESEVEWAGPDVP